MKNIWHFGRTNLFGSGIPKRILKVCGGTHALRCDDHAVFPPDRIVKFRNKFIKPGRGMTVVIVPHADCCRIALGEAMIIVTASAKCERCQ